MPDHADDDRSAPASERREPVGAPVVRGDPEVAGKWAANAVAFDPDDEESLRRAAETVRSFADAAADLDDLRMLRGAAACAALVRGSGSYTAAADRAGEGVTVSFLRKWARVHDLPQSIRRRVAAADIPPSAAGHVARVTGTDRFDLAWAVLDHDLAVRTVREVASEVVDGSTAAEALADRDIALGERSVRLPVETYRELHRRAALQGRDVDALLAEAVDEWLDGEP